VAAHAIARAALAVKTTDSPEAALGAARPGPVPRRVAALLRPAPRRGSSWQGGLLLAGVLFLVAIAGASALEAARDLHALLELASGGQ